MLLNNGSLVLRPPPFLYFFWFVLNIIHGSGKSSENGEGLETFIT